MDDWQKQWLKQIEKASAEFEGFLVEVEEATESFVDEVSENVNSFFEQFQSEFANDVDSLIQELADILIDTSEEIDSVFREDWDDFSDENFTSVSYQAPSIENNPACINCSNYHGQSYNGNLLVCAMYPSGYEGDSCPDWEEGN